MSCSFLRRLGDAWGFFDYEVAAVEECVLVERGCCINCESSAVEVLWQGSFDSPQIQHFLAQCYYSTDVTQVLQNSRFELVRCRECTQMYHRRVLSERWLEELYSVWIDDNQVTAFEAAHGSGSEGLRFERARQWAKHVLRIAHLRSETAKTGLKLLDFGCGAGEFLALAASFGFSAFGVDLSEGRDVAAGRAGVRVFRDLDAFDAFGVGDLDAITLFQVLEHVPKPLDLLEDLVGRLKTGGVLVIEVPDCSDLAPERDFQHFHAVHPLEHINAFTPHTLRSMAQRAGLRQLPRPAAHVTTRLPTVAKTELSRWYQPRCTNQYFVK